MKAIDRTKQTPVRTKIKLCGLFRPVDIEYANRAAPDLAGFILSPGFRRSICREQAVAFRRALYPQMQAVGVFVNAPCEEILSYLNEGIVQIVQLHGNETEEEIQYIKAYTGKPVWKAVKVRSRADVEAWLDSAADCLVLDGGKGAGVKFDWSLLGDIDREYFLAGGLNPENLREAIETLHPYGVDLSSGVETDGAKDEEKMREAVQLAHAVCTVSQH